MRKSITLSIAIALAAVAGSAAADANLAKAKNCLACHTVEAKLVGPAFKDIGKKYAADKGATDKMAKKIREGGVGVWGQIPMPANPQVNADEAETLAKWVLSIK